jgi:UDP-N-acetylmuramoyl-L-alanyl-D-glutamate--2,6-diaminopimelate ligase
VKLNSIKELKSIIVDGDADIEFSGVNCDSRLVRRGDLFVAIDGCREDGSRYISNAFERGASGAVSSKAPQCVGARCVQVTDPRRAAALIAAAVHDWPARRMDIFAVTGTNGKTTSAWLLSEMLKSAGRKAGLFSTVSITYPDREIPALRTTPDACTLQTLLADMQRAQCDAVVMECSSHALHQQRVAGIPFKAGIFTNLSQDHLDYHHNMQAYFDAKLLLFRQMAELNPAAPAFCCIDGEYGLRMAAAVRSLKLPCVTIGFSEQADLRINALRSSAAGSSFVLNGCGACNLEFNTSLAGRYNVQNIACAAATAQAFGTGWPEIIRTVAAQQAKWGRLERVPLNDCPYDAFVDYAHTDDALRNVLTTLREITKKRLIVVFGCGGDRDKTKRPLMGRVCTELADVVIVTSDNPRSENPNHIIADIMRGIPQHRHLHVCPDRREAIRTAVRLAAADDVLLIAGKGHECFQECAGRSLPFDDRQVLMEERDCLDDDR